MLALDEYVGRISQNRDLLAVVLHGSLATGRHTGSSDVDLLIILEESRKPYLDRIPEYIDQGFPAPMDPKVYTIAEVQAELAKRGSLVREALSTGKYLYRKPGAQLPAGIAPARHSISQRGSDHT
ncbi:MAG: nucleotidyltransferase domain-containing protein [Bacillota bacterium]|nr:nucleotidyltransferase domain-containing protein [Bacillota bacterium]